MCYSLDFRKKVLLVRVKDSLTISDTAKRFEIYLIKYKAV